MFSLTSRYALVLAGLLLVFPPVVRADEMYKLEEPVDDIGIYGVGTRVDIKGKLQMEPKSAHLSQTVSAALSYRERRMLGPGNDAESYRSVREYETAEAQIAVDGNRTVTRLPDQLKLIVAQGRYDGVELSGLSGLLTSDELDLIRSPADSLALISLLPSKEVAVGDKWTVPGWAFQMLTALDAVVKGELVCTLDSVEKGIAHIKMNGALEGAAVGSMTEVKVSGHFNYNVDKKYIAETDFVQTELRAFGPVSPGLDITARIRVLRQPVASAGKLSEPKTIDAAANDSNPEAKFLRFESPWNIGFQYGRHWHLYQVYEKSAVIRLIHEGNFVAQCDMAPISQAKPGGHLAEQVYLADIRQSLGDRLRTMTAGEVIPSSDRKFIFKVTAEGSDGKREITWVFYLVADSTGRQASLMFTVDTPLVETLGKYDREIVDSLKFGPPPVPRAATK